jgi:hypothetical protein
VDAVLCRLQTGTQESQPSRSRSLRVRLGVVTTLVIPNPHHEYLIQHPSVPLAMRDINLTRQYRMTLSSEHVQPGWYGTCLYNGASLMR